MLTPVSLNARTNTKQLIYNVPILNADHLQHHNQRSLLKPNHLSK